MGNETNDYKKNTSVQLKMLIQLAWEIFKNGVPESTSATEWEKRSEWIKEILQSNENIAARAIQTSIASNEIMAFFQKREREKEQLSARIRDGGENNRNTNSNKQLSGIANECFAHIMSMV